MTKSRQYSSSSYAQSVPPLSSSGQKVTDPTKLNGDSALDYVKYTGVSKVTPAPAPPTVQPIPPSESVGFKEWVASQKEFYFRLKKEAMPYAGSQAMLLEQREVVERLIRAKDVAQKDVKQLRQTESEVLKALEKKRHKKDKKKQEALEAQLVEIEKALGPAEEQLADAERQLQPELQEKERLEAASRREAEIVAQMEAILSSLYDGTAGDDRENAAESSVQFFRQLGWQIDVALTDQREAFSYITKAAECVERMLKLLQASQRSNAVDMFSDDLLGFAAGMRTNAMLAEVRRLGKESQKYIKAAHKYSPYMPSARKAQAGLGELMAFTNVVFDSLFVDLAQGAYIRKQIEKIRLAYEETLYSQQWQAQFVKNIKKDRDTNALNLQKAQERLLAERMRLLEIGDGACYACLVM